MIRVDCLLEGLMRWPVHRRSVMLLWLIETVFERLTIPRAVWCWGRSKAVVPQGHGASSQSNVYIGRQQFLARTCQVLLFDIGFGQVSVLYGQATWNTEVVWLSLRLALVHIRSSSIIIGGTRLAGPWTHPFTTQRPSS